jgi:regulator of nucleoside diphosphate kinase
MTISGETLAPSLSGIWSALHQDIELWVRDCELHYLKMLALTADDDLVSHLLLAKLRLAGRVDHRSAPASLVVMNSFLEYRLDGGGRSFCQLVHPTAPQTGYGVSIQSLLGAGLIGLRAGQTILWPDESGSLRDLDLLHVENCPGLSNWLGEGAMEQTVRA